MQRPQFGQRGITINGEPVDVAANVARSASRSASSPDGERIGALRTVGILFIAFLFLAWFEALMAGTSLITPINQTLLWTMRGIGLVVGLGVTCLAVLAMSDVSFLKRGATLLVCPLLIAFGFGEIAYRISDWTEFGFSRQPFEQAEYPIDSIHHGRKGARSTIRIDPFETGDATDIPLSSEQYRELLKTSASSCVTAMQRKSPSGAIEIATNGRYVFNTPEEVPVHPCIGSAHSASRNTANPWGKD